MNILKLNNGNTYFLSNYSDLVNQIELTVSGMLVSEIKGLTTDALKEVQILTEDNSLIGTYTNLELDDDISYNTTFDQTKFTLVRNGIVSSVNDMKDTVDLLKSLISTTTEKSDKTGYLWKITKIGDVEVLKEYIEDPDGSTDDHDGSDYTKPAYYTVGDTVTKGLWYCVVSDPALVYECIKDGVPTSFTDTEYFDVV